MRRFFTGLFILALVAGCGDSGSGKKKKSRKKKAEGSQNTDPVKDAATTWVASLPRNRPGHQVRIPAFDEEGKRTSLLEAARFEKVDDENVEVEDLRLQFQPEEPPNSEEVGLKSPEDAKIQERVGPSPFVITSPRAYLNGPKAVLSSSERTKILMEGVFQGTGDEFLFDTKRQTGSLLGNVRMTFEKPSSPSPDSTEKQQP